jgi:hypothetical protein
LISGDPEGLGPKDTARRVNASAAAPLNPPAGVLGPDPASTTRVRVRRHTIPRVKIAKIRQKPGRLIRNHFQQDAIGTIVGEGSRKLYAVRIFNDGRKLAKP